VTSDVARRDRDCSKGTKRRPHGRSRSKFKGVELSVERLLNGEVSPYLARELKVGDQLELRGPIGGWFIWRPQQTEPIQLIAGGVPASFPCSPARVP